MAAGPTTAQRVLAPGAATSTSPDSVGSEVGLGFVSSRPLGITWALDGIWAQLDLPKTLTTLLGATRREPTEAARVERVLLALVAARAIDPASKLSTAAWLGRRTWIAGLTDSPTAGTPDGVGLISDDE